MRSLRRPPSFTTSAVPSAAHPVSGVYEAWSAVEYSKDRFCTQLGVQAAVGGRLMSSEKTPYIVSSIVGPCPDGSTVIG
ncbi:hypothetical protein STENM327S_08897 [Streptomyces tendae]